MVLANKTVVPKCEIICLPVPSSLIQQEILNISGIGKAHGPAPISCSQYSKYSLLSQTGQASKLSTMTTHFLIKCNFSKDHY